MQRFSRRSSDGVKLRNPPYRPFSLRSPEPRIAFREHLDQPPGLGREGQNLRTPRGVLRCAVESSGGSRNLGVRSRRFRRGAEFRNALQIPEAPFRVLQRDAVDSRVPPYLPAHARFFPGVPDSSGARFKIPSSLRAFRVAPEFFASRRSLLGRSRRFSRPFESSAPRPEIRRGALSSIPLPRIPGAARIFPGPFDSSGRGWKIRAASSALFEGL